jgi:hypothetical protein
MKLGNAPLHSIRLLDQVRKRFLCMQYSLITETNYLYWVKFFVFWYGHNGVMRHSRETARPEINQFEFNAHTASPTLQPKSITNQLNMPPAGADVILQ